MADNSTFRFTLNGKTVSIPLAKARALCPMEVEEMEQAGERVSEAAERGDSQAMADASDELGKRMQALFKALAEQASRQQDLDISE